MSPCLAPSVAYDDPRHNCPAWMRLSIPLSLGSLAAQSDIKKYHYCAEVNGRVIDCPDIPRLARETGLDRHALRLVFKRHGDEGRFIEGVPVWRKCE